MKLDDPFDGILSSDLGVLMRVAIQNPLFLFDEDPHRRCGYGFEFFKAMRPAIFLTHWSEVWTYGKRLRQLGFNPLNFKFLLSKSALNAYADALISFNGALDQLSNCPVASFHGLKVAYLAEFYRNPRRSCQNLVDCGVDYVLGNGDHPKYSELFRQHFKPFIDRLLPVPLGFSFPFHKRRAFDSRITRCLLTMQTPTPICDPSDEEGCRDYFEYYSHQEVSFPWLAHLRSHYFELHHILELHVEEDLFRGLSNTQTYQKLNEYMLFTAEAGLLGYPCARVFEGVAAGAVLVAPEHDCFKDLGFEHGKNCLFHKPNDQEDFARVVTEALRDIPKLAKMADCATHWVHATFSREAIAKWLYESLLELTKSEALSIQR